MNEREKSWDEEVFTTFRGPIEGIMIDVNNHGLTAYDVHTIWEMGLVAFQKAEEMGAKFE